MTCCGVRDAGPHPLVGRPRSLGGLVALVAQAISGCLAIEAQDQQVVGGFGRAHPLAVELVVVARRADRQLLHLALGHLSHPCASRSARPPPRTTTSSSPRRRSVGPRTNNARREARGQRPIGAMPATPGAWYSRRRTSTSPTDVSTRRDAGRAYVRSIPSAPITGLVAPAPRTGRGSSASARARR